MLPSYVAAGFTPSVSTTFGVPKFISVNLTLETFVIVGDPLVLTAVQPITAGTELRVVLVEKLSSEIAFPLVNTAEGILPKLTTIVFELLRLEPQLQK